MDLADAVVLKQHLIDPEICIRCNTCEATCPVGAVTHDDRNYVVDPAKCNACLACLPPCPTGSIDNWRRVPLARAYSVAEQLGWDELPDELPPEALAEAGAADTAGEALPVPAAPTEVGAEAAASAVSVAYGATVPPWSAAHPYTNLYGPKAAQRSVTATVVGNVRVTEVGTEYDTHHLVLDFGSTPFPVLEGQSIGVLPPGSDAAGRPHHARQYSIASPRNGERPGYNNVSLTIKRVLEDHQGRPVRGVASNYLCDRQVGDTVQVIGPFGSSFLMPNHPRSHLVMICTGTGSAPMRAMTEWRRRQRAAAAAGARQGHDSAVEGGKLLLFFGARTREELPYFGPLQNLPKDFIDIHLAFSRTPGSPKRYVQDLMRERAADLAPLLADPNAHFYVCGLKAMEEGVVLALRDIATQAGQDWAATAEALKSQGRLHLETY
ncbi:benzoyl-CoA 2,3-epoxidase subunit BoxA [Piscinibacter sakaiensis]|uniref:Benzoyl-CoA oxygenase component A n=1 Tax=Piscinibacter sakaiensis TaxID=1547922 RepID=A0A0K8P2Y2_PISS1|nr:benzoyl-CoA 2,3-epoxidase subunit BoxA [Piscinibacter sakaiensis]GAP36968.1 benzoyl-CoA oxygenase, component A [Piscinibacter sakaiensis]